MQKLEIWDCSEIGQVIFLLFLRFTTLSLQNSDIEAKCECFNTRVHIKTLKILVGVLGSGTNVCDKKQCRTNQNAQDFEVESV